MSKLILIFLGSGIGGVARYSLSGWVQHCSTPLFPTGTLVVNVIGCLLIGFLGALFASASGSSIKEEYRVAIVIGILGGFTTFSAFGKETVALAADRHLAQASLNVVLSVVLGLGAVWLGARIAKGAYGA